MDEFFQYFATSKNLQKWGIQATAFGHGTIPPHAAYPLSRHPRGHHFSWNQGRVLSEYQIVFISAGRGSFQCNTTKTSKIEAGSVFLLFPGVWHRYCPDPKTGWTEWWIAIKGDNVDRLRDEGIINPAHSVFDGSRSKSTTVFPMFREAARLAQLKPRGLTIRLGMIAMHLLTILYWGCITRSSVPSAVLPKLRQARDILSRENVRTSPEKIASQLNMGYSQFRKVFKRFTGFSAKQYQVEVRHQRAKELLGGTDLTLKEIAERLGYDSPYHLSLDFKKRTQISPGRWRSGPEPAEMGVLALD